jgi:uncharacterized membrane protein YedE/YeeE
MKLNLSAFFCGALFAVGLVTSGMTQPAKVTTVFLFRFAIFKLPRPLLTSSFPDLATQPVNARLVIGAAIFGVGWGIVGYCPGPALIAVGSAVMPAIVFVLAMSVGIRLSDWVTGTKGDPVAKQTEKVPQLSILHGIDG